MINNNSEVLQTLKDANIWTLSTSGEDGALGIPNRFHTVTEDGKLVIARVYMKKTVENIEYCNKVCISAFTSGEGGSKGYMIFGTAEYLTEGKYSEIADKLTQPLRNAGRSPLGGAVVVTPVKIVVATPGPANGTVVN